MSGTTPNSVSEEGTPPQPAKTPPSLLQLAPKSVRLLHKNEPLPMRKGRYSILTGKPFEVVVIPQSPDDIVEIKSEIPIQQTSGPHKIFSSGEVRYEGRFLPKLNWKTVPHVVYAKVWVTISRPGIESRQLKLSIRIRPTIFLYVMSILLAFVALSAQRLTKVLTDADSVQSAFQKIVDDLPTLGSFFAVSTLVVIPVKILGLFFTRSTLTGEDD